MASAFVQQAVTDLIVRRAGLRRTLADAVAVEVATRRRSGCWVWPGSVNRKGYPRIAYKGRDTLVSHVVLDLEGRPRPAAPDDRALHACDRPSCYNPAHLSWGSNAENVRQMVERGRTHDRSGMSNHRARITDDDVRRIRSLAADGVTRAVIAQTLGYNRSSITRIVNRQRWAHVS